VGNVFQNAPRHGGSLWTVYELQQGILTGLKFGGGVSASTYRFVDPSNDLVLPGYSIVSVALPKHFGMLSTCDQLVYCGNFSPVCSRTMYSAYQSGQFLSACPLLSSN
jgi:hypothetical protein